MPAQRFLENRLDVREAVAVVKGRQPIASHHSVDFLVRLALDFGVQDHGEEERVHHADGLKKASSAQHQTHMGGCSWTERAVGLTVSAPPVYRDAALHLRMSYSSVFIFPSLLSSSVETYDSSWVFLVICF